MGSDPMLSPHPGLEVFGGQQGHVEGRQQPGADDGVRGDEPDRSVAPQAVRRPGSLARGGLQGGAEIVCDPRQLCL